MKIKKLTSYYFFWVNSAFLLYFLVPFFIYIFENQVRESNILVLQFLFVIHGIVSLIFYFVVTIGIWKIRNKSQYI